MRSGMSAIWTFCFGGRHKSRNALVALGTIFGSTAVGAAISALIVAGGAASGIIAVITALGVLAVYDWKAAAAVLTAPFTANLGSTVTALVRLGNAFFGDAVARGIDAIVSLLNRIAAFAGTLLPSGSPGAGALGPSYLTPPAFNWRGWGGVPKPTWEPPAPSNSAPAPGGFMWTPPQRMNYIPTGATEPRLMNASWAPPPAPKPVTVAMTLNIDGRTLAQAVSTEIADLHDFSGGAPAGNSYADYHGADSQFSST